MSTPDKSPAPATTPTPTNVTTPAPATKSTAPTTLDSVTASATASLKNVTQSWNSNSSAVCAQTKQAKVFWNEQIAKPANQGIRVANVEFQKVRQQYPAALIAGTTGAVFLLSALASRGTFRTLRNTTFAALFSGLAVAPNTTIGLMALTRDRIAAAAGYNRPTTVVVQQPTTPSPAKQ